METENASLAAIHAAWNPIYQALFRIDGEPIDLPAALVTLADAINAHDGETEDWLYIGDGTETCLSDFIPGAYWALAEWHGGQSSDSYRALCALGGIFSPGHTSAPESEEESEWTGYDAVNQWFQNQETLPYPPGSKA